MSNVDFLGESSPVAFSDQRMHPYINGAGSAGSKRVQRVQNGSKTGSKRLRLGFSGT